MGITSGHDDVGFSLKLVGELVKENVRAFIEEVVKVPTGTPETLRLDMAEVPSIDSSGLGALILVHKRWKKRAEPVCLVNLEPSVESVLSTTGLLAHFKVQSEGES